MVICRKDRYCHSLFEKSGIHRFMEKGSCVTAIGFVRINRVKRLEVYNIGATTPTKIAST